MDESCNDEIEELLKTTMEEVFECEPRPFQKEAISKLIKMSLGILNPQPIFLCQPTGGGKSFVRDVFAASVGGITINIAPLLSLSADQNNKLKSKCKCKNVHSLHLDEYNDAVQISEIKNLLLKHPQNSPVSLILFTSPQRLVEYPEYLDTIDTLIGRGTLKLVSIDEVHLFTQFGLWFRLEFIKLKHEFFSKVMNKVPILFMTASANESVIFHLELLTGIQLKNENYIWPNAEGMMCRKQSILFNPTPQFNRALTSNTSSLGSNKFIVYANSREKIINKYKSFREWLDKNNPDLDLISIVGTNRREVKFHRTTLFLGDGTSCNSNNNDTHKDDNIYHPQGCFTTRSLGSAGWDSKAIRFVFSVDLPTDILSVLQEKGRCGRYKDADGQNNKYIVLGTLHDIEYMLRRILSFQGNNNNKVDPDAYHMFDKLLTLKEYKSLQLNNYHSVLDFFILPTKCQHIVLEELLCNPTEKKNNYLPEPCRSFCQYCINKGIHPSFKPIHISGGKQILSNLFIADQALVQPGITSELVDGIINYPNAQMLLFGSKSKKKPPRCDISRFIMLLITARLVGYKLITIITDEKNINGDRIEKEKLIGFLATDNHSIPLIFNDTNWSRLPQKGIGK